MTRVLSLCADDFGIDAGVSSGIARLAHAQRLTAVSCITNSKRWAEDVGLLNGLPDTVDVGLHLNLTEGKPASARLGRIWPRLPSLPRLIALAHLGRLPRAALRSELHAQLSAFIAARNERPKFIDGHQHVHHLPGVRDIVLDMVEHIQPLPAVRSTGRVLGPGFGLKRWLIERTGGANLMASLRAHVLPHNPALLGVYDFASTDYRRLMQRWLDEIPAEGALLFCHPGDPKGDDDPIAAARLREINYLGGELFLQDLAAANVVLGRVWQTPPPLGANGAGVT
jgi:predicted glycoside hydrolase/deacetylase ChbG (UPF0249 family)